jgi:hypothetical protein
MKNIHLIPTDKPSRLFLKENTLLLNNQYTLQKIFTKGKCQNIYITSDLEVKEGDLKVGEYYLYFNKIRQFKEIDNLNRAWKDYKKIILTTDQDLIANGVQAIDDEFLEWFVKNPSCEWVEVIYDKDAFPYGVETAKGYGWYKIIIPQEKSKQETLEEAAKKQWGNIHRTGVLGFIEGAKWQEKRRYSEEEVIEIIDKWVRYQEEIGDSKSIPLPQFIEQFKKK